MTNLNRPYYRWDKSDLQPWEWAGTEFCVRTGDDGIAYWLPAWIHGCWAMRRDLRRAQGEV